MAQENDGLEGRDAKHVRSVLDSVRRIVRMLRLTDRAAERRLGLSGAQLFVLQKLASGPAISLNELAHQTITDQSSVSVIVTKLVDAKLARRIQSKVDRRRVELSLTAAGKALVKRTPTTGQDQLIEAVRHLSQANIRQLAILLNQVVREAGIEDQSATMFFEEQASAKSGKSKSKSRK